MLKSFSISLALGKYSRASSNARMIQSSRTPAPPRPLSATRAACDVVAVPGPRRRIVQRLVHDLDLLEIREFARDRRQPDANGFLLLRDRQTLRSSPAAGCPRTARAT